MADPPRRVWRDWALVGVTIPVAVLEGIFAPGVVWRPVAIVLTLAVLPALLWRRTHPLAMTWSVFGAFVVVDVARLAAGVEAVTLTTMIICLLLPYALTRWGSGRDVILALPPIVVASSLAVVFDYTGIGDAIGGYTVLGLALASGAVVRSQQKERAQAVERVRLLERESLARDLHDTVAHHVSAILIRAQAGLATAPTSPSAATDALAVIEAEASRTLTEMRTIVGVLRADAATGTAGDSGIEAARSPLPTVADLGALIDDAPGGPLVHLRLGGDLDGLAPAVSTAIYRMAQESITNARRHARNATRVDVDVTADDTAVHLSVRDDGARTGGSSDGLGVTGFGIVGMVERADLLGGTCAAGPGRHGGWVVSATLPRLASAAEPLATR
ncbi:MAG: sensor histidine kinase [Acidimicrobiales bacterium]